MGPSAAGEYSTLLSACGGRQSAGKMAVVLGRAGAAGVAAIRSGCTTLLSAVLFTRNLPAISSMCAGCPLSA